MRFDAGRAAVLCLVEPFPRRGKYRLVVANGVPAVAGREAFCEPCHDCRWLLKTGWSLSKADTTHQAELALSSKAGSAATLDALLLGAESDRLQKTPRHDALPALSMAWLSQLPIANPL